MTKQQVNEDINRAMNIIRNLYDSGISAMTTDQIRSSLGKAQSQLRRAKSNLREASN